MHDEAKRDAATLSLQLLPFAGIAFLWFIGVLRDRIGQHEDRFFATVFLGSGLLFVGTFFVAGSLAAGLISTAADAGPVGRLGSVWPFGRRAAATLATVYGLRMAAVFTISATTIASRLRLVPRWLAVLGYATAVSLLVRGRCRALGRADLPRLGVRTQRAHPRRRVPRQARRDRRPRVKEAHVSHRSS